MRRVAFNVMYLVPGEVGGSETYARELIKALVDRHPETHFFAYCGREARTLLRALAPADRLTVHALPVRSSIKPLRILAELLLLPLWALRDRPQILHSLGNTAPLIAPGLNVVSVLDLIFDRFAGTFPPLARKGLQLLVPLAVRRADRVIAISQHTKNDLTERYGTKADKIDVVYLGSGAHPTNESNPGDETALRRRLGLPDGPFVLTVASGLVHKNLARLLDAFAALTKTDNPSATTLVITGHFGLESELITKRVTELGLSDRVVMTGWVSADELQTLYEAADCFVFPSLYEGFGLPVLEAMSRGTPVACSNAASIPEVAGDAALMFDPLDTDAIGRAIERLLSDVELRERLVVAGHEQSARFTWDETARGTWQSYLAAADM